MLHASLGNPLDVFKNPLDRPETLHQGNGGFFADARDSGDIIRFVPRQTEHVYDERGSDTEFILHRLFIEQFPVIPALSGPVHFHIGGDQLHEVLVARHEICLDSLRLGPARQSPHHVIGFVPRKLDAWDVESPDNLFQEIDLAGKVFRHLFTGRLVWLVHDMAEGRLLRVEHDGDMIRLFIQDLHERVHEAEDGTRVLTPGIDERAAYEREVSAISQRHAVEQEQALACLRGLISFAAH